MLCAFCTNIAEAFALAVVQDTLERLDSYQDVDYSGLLLRLEYLNRIIINCGDLPDPIVACIYRIGHYMFIERREIERSLDLHGKPFTHSPQRSPSL